MRIVSREEMIVPCELMSLLQRYSVYRKQIEMVHRERTEERMGVKENFDRIASAHTAETKVSHHRKVPVKLDIFHHSTSPPKLPVAPSPSLYSLKFTHIQPRHNIHILFLTYIFRFDSFHIICPHSACLPYTHASKAMGLSFFSLNTTQTSCAEDVRWQQQKQKK